MCGCEYEVCYSCSKINSWRMHTDTEEHFYIFGVLMEYLTSHNAENAYEQLLRRGIDPHNTDGFLPGPKELMEEICSAGSKIGGVRRGAAKAKKSSDKAKEETVMIERNEQEDGEGA